MSKFIGDVSAYAYAVSKGYTGTEEEFAELMASYATVGQTAVDAKDAAIVAKTAAQTAATTATNKAGEATTAAQTATTKAGEASQSASQAQASAQTASTKASEASASASTASAKATEATTAAATAVSAKDDAVSANTAAQSAKTAAQTAQTGAETAAASVQASAAQIQTNADDISELKEDLTAKADVTDLLKAFPTDTASGAIASFSDGANVPVKSLIVNIDPVQSGSGYPSPTNVRPISGWSEVNVSHSGADMTNPTVISIQLGQTVYGGTLNVTNGVLTVDRTMVDLGTLNYRYNLADSLAFDTQVTLTPSPKNNNCICSNYKTLASPTYSNIVNNDKFVAINATDDGTQYTGNYAKGVLIVKDTTYTDATAFKSAMSGVMLCYPLATPLTVQLTPHEVRSLLGSNNVWADCGDTEVTYRADPTLYISRLTEPDADMIADSNITSGQYFMVGNTLYKATANIASGGAITPNVNCTRKSLSEALNELNA